MSRFTLFDFMISSVIDDDHIPLKILCYYRTFIPIFCIFMIPHISTLYLSFIYLLYFIYYLFYIIISLFYSYTIDLL